MSTEEEKGITELTIFEQFAHDAGLQLAEGSAEKMLGVSMPDIKCRINDETVYFELTESCAPGFVEALSKMEKDDFSQTRWNSDEIDKVVLNKLKKNYLVNAPIELLIYTDGMNALSDEDIISRVKSCLKNGLGPFRRVWFYSNGQVDIL